MMKEFSVLILLNMLIFSCSKEDTSEDRSNCDFQTIVSSELYSNSTSDQVDVNRLTIENNCLIINLSASGCSGDTWEVQLIDSEAILESSPPQRNLKLILKNEELCLAYITKEFTFDMSHLKVEGNQVQLNITNTNQTIMYEY